MRRRVRGEPFSDDFAVDLLDDELRSATVAACHRQRCAIETLWATDDLLCLAVVAPLLLFFRRRGYLGYLSGAHDINIVSTLSEAPASQC